MANQYYLVPNSSGTAFTGTGMTPDGTFPDGVIPCTEEQAKNFQAYVPNMSTTPPSVVSAPSAQLLAQAQAIQRALIKSSFITASTANVTDSNGIIWEGGMQSGNSIFLGCQLAQQAGQTTITLYDASKAPHSMTIAEGMGVAALIGAAYQQALATKNSLYAQIDAATSVAAVQAIVWP